MAKRLQGLIAGIIIGVLMTGSVAFAANRALDAYYNNIKIVIDGTEINPTDASGKTVEPFIVNGTTYLPIRAIANALGKEVYWDGPNYTAYLGDMDGKLEHPTLKMEDAIEIGGNSIKQDNAIKDNYGNTYVTSISCRSYGTRTWQTLLNMKYSRFKGTVYVPNGTSTNSSQSFSIECDGKVVYQSPDITKTSEPIRLDIDINGCNDFKINLYQASSYAFYFYIGDAGFYQ